MIIIKSTAIELVELHCNILITKHNVMICWSKEYVRVYLN